MRTLFRILAVATLLPLAACALDAAVAQTERRLRGIAPIGTLQVLVLDAAGSAFRTVPTPQGLFSLAIESTRPVTVFVIDDDATRALRVPSTEGGVPEVTRLPQWSGTVNLGLIRAAGADAVEAEDNPLDQVDTDGDGSSNLEDEDDDGDGELDDDDGDADGSGTDDTDEDLDSDDDGLPDLIDELDDNDDDSDDDGVNDDLDEDDDNDGIEDVEEDQV
ncbi:MAG: hypothetical protein Q8O67_15600 [Deltaproteobacteria bacterium]|nr:hypothetical protein [Deltaproteobacteria bacterium]